MRQFANEIFIKSIFFSRLSLIAGSLINLQAADRVKTKNGIVEGTGKQKSGVRIFKGIPFAAPPVGDLRWQPPQPAKNWKGVRDATKFGRALYAAARFSAIWFFVPTE